MPAGGIQISEMFRSAWALLLVSLMLATLPAAVSQEGICPNYYGPFDPDPTGNESCQSAIPSGTFTLRWAHGNESNLSWEDLGTVEMKANVRYLLAYNETAEFELGEFNDSTLNGNTGICFANLGPDALFICLKPEMGEGQQAPAGQQNGQPNGQQQGPGQGPDQQGQQGQQPPGQGGQQQVPS